MKFVTNKISTGKAKTFADLVEDYRNKIASLQKQASQEAVVKTARTDAIQEEGESSGQLDVEPLHQEGESTPKVKGKSGGEGSEKIQPEAAANTTVKAADCGVCDKDNENNGPAEESGQTKADFPKRTNDPEAGKHRDGDGDQKKAETETPVVTAGGKGSGGSKNFGDKKAPEFGTEKTGDEDAEEVEAKKKPCSDGKKKKASDRKFVVVANLDSKSKNWLKKYWSDLYQSDYADAMTADK